MSFTSSTGALNHNDLLDLLNTWLTVTLGTWTELEYSPADSEAVSVDSIVDDGDSGYAVDDTITLTGGTFTTATVLIVTSVDGGGQITGVSIDTAGQYSVVPGDPVAQGSTSGSGVGTPTFNMTYGIMAKDTATLSLEGPGNGAAARTYINIETDYDDGNSYYGWTIYGATDWDSGIAFGSQTGAGGPVYLNMWQNAIDYWFFANTRRFIVEAKVSSNYVGCYAGFFLPLASPTEYPFPLAIIGNYHELNLASVVSAANSHIADPGEGAAQYRRRTSEVWADIKNQRDVVAAVAPSTATSTGRAFIWPHKTGQGYASYQASPNSWNSAGFNLMKLNYEDEAPLIQCHIIDTQDGVAVGALDGVYSTTGFDRSTEQQLSSGGRDFRLFQKPVINNPGDFFAVEEV